MEALVGGRGMELVLLHEINAGTFARLYLAEARAAGGLDRIVAVKILREQWSEQAEVVSRTRDEARLLGRLRHKNILRVEDLVEVDGQTAIIMEFVDGLDLKQLVEALRQRGQRLPPKVALQVVQESASALEAAYFRTPTGMDRPLRVVHRDLKPSNVMVSIEGEVRVLDFGTARSSAVFRSAQTGALRFGSLKYMSPERREGDRGEHAGDVYALGLVLIELLRTEWLPLLPMDTREHDEALASAIARLGDLGMPNRDWDLTLRQVLGQMVAGQAGDRPNAQQVVKLMREFVEHASGPLLDRFAQETVLPLTRELTGPSGGGALAGTRLVVNPISARPDTDSGPGRGGENGRVASGKSTVGPAPPLRSVAMSEPPPTPAGRAGSASVIGAPAPGQAPMRPPDLGRAPVPQGQPHQAPARHGASIAAGQVVEAPRRPVTEVDEPAPAEEGNGAAGGGAAMAIGAGVLVLFILGGLLLLVGGIGAWMYWGRGGEAVAVEPAGVEQGQEEPADAGGGSAGGTASGGTGAGGTGTGSTGTVSVGETTGSAPTGATTHVGVALEGEPAQWIKLQRGGETRAEARGNLDSAVAPGTYTLAIKVVGRTAVSGEVEVPDGGIDLTCSADSKQNVRCTGNKRTVTLKP